MQIQKAHAVDLRSTKVDEWNIPEGRNRPMRKYTIGLLVSDIDPEKGMLVDPPPDIIDKNRRVRENPEEECSVPRL